MSDPATMCWTLSGASWVLPAVVDHCVLVFCSHDQSLCAVPQASFFQLLVRNVQKYRSWKELSPLYKLHLYYKTQCDIWHKTFLLSQLTVRPGSGQPLLMLRQAQTAEIFAPRFVFLLFRFMSHDQNVTDLASSPELDTYCYLLLLIIRQIKWPPTQSLGPLQGFCLLKGGFSTCICCKVFGGIWGNVWLINSKGGVLHLLYMLKVMRWLLL